MRLFVACWPPAAVRTDIAALVDAGRSEPGAHRLRWVPPDRWHVTLAFLGDVAPSGIAALGAALDEVACPRGPVPATLGPAMAVLGRGVLCVPVTGLDDLAVAVDDRLSTGRSPLRFRGHVTVARAGRGVEVAVAAGPALSSGWSVGSVDLVVSVPVPGGVRYATVHRSPLSGPTIHQDEQVFV